MRAIRAVWARECTAMPASTMVLLRPLLSRLERARANTTASSAPAKADSVTAAAPDRNKMPAAAPALAPEDTPMMSGEASGLRNTVWYTNPATPRAKPPTRPTMVLDRRKVTNTRH